MLGWLDLFDWNPGSQIEPVGLSRSLSYRGVTKLENDQILRKKNYQTTVAPRPVGDFTLRTRKSTEKLLCVRYNCQLE